MSQQFTQQVKTRVSVLVFLKGAAAPLVLYVENPTELYNELIGYVGSAANKVIEKDTNGPIRKVAFCTSQISAIAMQEEQYIQ